MNFEDNFFLLSDKTNPEKILLCQDKKVFTNEFVKKS